MTLPEKPAKEGSLAENVHILVKANVSAHKLRVAQIFQSFSFILEGLGCCRRHFAVPKDCCCPAEMQIKIKKEGEELFSATHGISPFDFPQGSMVKRGNKHGQRNWETFYQEK